jgi:DNA-binding response OmpR family regulator
MTPASTAKRILIADDNRDWADALALLLKYEGYDVRAVYDGRDAVEAAREFKPHVVILDLAMPRMTGYEVGRAFSREAARPVTIAVTGWPRESGKLDAEIAGFDHYLGKGAGPQGILELLKRL